MDSVRDIKQWWTLVREYINETISISADAKIEDFQIYFKALLYPARNQVQFFFAFPFIENSILDNPIALEQVIEVYLELSKMARLLEKTRYDMSFSSMLIITFTWR